MIEFNFLTILTWLPCDTAVTKDNDFCANYIINLRGRYNSIIASDDLIQFISHHLFLISVVVVYIINLDIIWFTIKVHVLFLCSFFNGRFNECIDRDVLQSEHERTERAIDHIEATKLS